MMRDLQLIVGDEYREFAAHDGVSCVSDTLRLLQTGDTAWRGTSLLVGQGIGRDVRRQLEEAAREAGAVVYPSTGTTPIALTHKSSASCVLITSPEKVAPGRYRAQLITGGEHDRLADHVTGQHMGGMLLVEAARQLGIAALELEYAADDGLMRYGLAWGSLVARFLSYAFPTPTELEVVLEQLPAKSRKNQPTIELTFQLTQAGQSVAEMVMETSLIEKATLLKLEARRAQQVVEKLCGAERAKLTDHAEARVDPAG
jgi:hypothetical protein